MKTNQLSIFEEVEVFSNNDIADVRREKQKGNLISYDVGEVIGGAKKDMINQYRQDFLANPSINLLQKLETIDVRTASEVIKRDTFFSWFSLEDCKLRGVEPGVAKAIQLFIKRIPKESLDSAEARKRYTKTLIILSSGLQGVYTKEEFFIFEKYIMALFSAKYNATKTICVGKLKYQERGYWMLHDLAESLAIHDFKGPFINYFYKPKSRIAALNKVIFEEDWENVFPATKPKKETTKKPREIIWKRELPLHPTRDAGTMVTISTPEEFVEQFGFRACEFGNWVEDQKAAFHLKNAAEAYMDLSEILTIPKGAVSLGGTLAMAFGSRGSGSALGHFESIKNVINLTKINGSLGILAHEWFHALDCYLFNVINDFENGKIGFLSNHAESDPTSKVECAMVELLKTIKEGNSTAYIDISTSTKRYSVYQSFEDMYKAVRGNLQSFMDIEIRSFDSKVQQKLKYCSSDKQRDALMLKYNRQRVKFIREQAIALSQYHFKQTGQQVNQVPYTSSYTVMYQNSILADKGVQGKYWSSNVELVARAFESYIAMELKKLRWTSDYLVCGASGGVYPDGEEAEKIHAAMCKFINLIRPFL